MFRWSGKQLSNDKIMAIRKSVIEASEAGDKDKAWDFLQPLIEAQSKNKSAADALVDIIDRGHTSREKAGELLSAIYQAHKDDDELVADIAIAMEAARDIDDLNAPPPDLPLFNTLIAHLSEMSLRVRGTELEAKLTEGFAGILRLNARQHDDLTARNYARLVELLPDTDWVHYNQGLFFKTRGLFKQGMAANQRAIELSDDPGQAYYWNLGICATGAGDGETALKVWKGQEQKIEMGQFDLPQGGYPSSKVKLAEFPLSERGKDNDNPGAEETIWIERLSPCHGIIRSVLFQDLGVDYGDVVLIDGAPITYHKYGEEQIPVFPHLSTLRRHHYQFYDFAGTQSEAGTLADISKDLDADAVVYSHTENYEILCAACWRDETIQHQHDQTEEKHIVIGRIAAPPDMAPAALLAQIDAALNDHPENRIFSPALCDAAGQPDRAKIEQRRFSILRSDG